MRLREDEVKCRETEVDREEKNLKNIIKAEKDKRLHLEERITTRRNDEGTKGGTERQRELDKTRDGKEQIESERGDKRN